MVLYDAAHNSVAGSYSVSNSESISLEGHATGVYYLEVYGWSDANAEYALSITAPDAPGPEPLPADGFTTYRAVLIDAYGANNDIYGVSDSLLMSEGGEWVADNITMVEYDDATVANIQTGIYDLASVTDQDDLALIYFTSHGNQTGSDNLPIDEPDAEDGFLNMIDGNITDDELGSWCSLFDTSWSLAEQFVMIVDACHSGEMMDGTADPAGETDNHVIMSACAADETAYGGNPYSEFTTGLVDALTAGAVTADLNNDGWISAEEMFYRAESFCSEQTPQIADTYPGELNLVYYNRSPVAADDAVATSEKNSLPIDVAANDTDPDRTDVLTVIGIDTANTIGTVIDNGDGTFRYDPGGRFGHLAAGETATDTFAYTISDGSSGTDTATVTVTVNPIDDPGNDTPVAVEPITTYYGIEADINVLGNNYDIETPDADLTYTVVTDPDHGWLRMNDIGLFEYEPHAEDTGTDSFQYTVTDRGADADTPGVDRTSDPITVNLTYVDAGYQEIVSDDRGRATYIDADGDEITVILGGAGQFTVHRNPVGGQGDALMIGVTGTNDRSRLIIRGGDTTVGDIRVEGPLGRLMARTTDLTDDLVVHGSLVYARLGDVTGADDGRSDIVANAGGGALGPRDRLTLNLGSVTNASLNTNGLPVNRLICEQWIDTSGTADDAINARWIGRLQTRGRRDNRRTPADETLTGDFNVDLALTGENRGYALRNARIRGDMSGTWDLTGAGDIGVVTVRGQVADALIDAPNSGIRTLRVGEWDDTGGDADAINARWIGRLQTRGRRDNRRTPADETLAGNLDVDLTLTGANRGWSLRNARITGDLGAPGAGRTWTMAGGLLGFTVFGTVYDSRLQAAGEARRLVMGAASGSDFLAGVDVGFAGAPADLAPGVFTGVDNGIGLINIRGWRHEGAQPVFLQNSRFAAPGIGRVRLTNYAAEDTYSLHVGSEDTMGVIAYRDTDNTANNWHWWPGQQKPAELLSGTGAQLNVVA